MRFFSLNHLIFLINDRSNLILGVIYLPLHMQADGLPFGSSISPLIQAFLPLRHLWEMRKGRLPRCTPWMTKAQRTLTRSQLFDAVTQLESSRFGRSVCLESADSSLLTRAEESGERNKNKKAPSAEKRACALFSHLWRWAGSPLQPAERGRC